MNHVEGAILTGGKSRRMGRDKSTLLLGGAPMLARVAQAMEPLVTRVRLVGGQPESTGGYPIQPDLRPGLGPLSGIHAALATAETPAVMVVACDLPFVTPRLLSGLVELLSSEDDAVMPRISGRAVPVCAVYRVTCVSALEAYLERGERAAHRFAAGLRTRWVEEDALRRLDPTGLTLRNINTPAELRDAEAIAAAKD